MTFDRRQDNDTIRNPAANQWGITPEVCPKRVAVSHFRADFKPISGGWRGTTPCNHFNYAITGGAVKGHDSGSLGTNIAVIP